MIHSTKFPAALFRAASAIALIVWVYPVEVGGFAARQHPAFGTRTVMHLHQNDTDASLVSLVQDGEPGEALIVSGKVFAGDGVTPAAGVTLYVYQTGVDGRYNRDSKGNPRIRGYVTTDEEGRYMFHTVKPGSYPGRRIAAHIHCRASGGGYPEQWVDDFLFEGDPFISKDRMRRSEDQGRLSPIMRVVRGGDGIYRCERDIILTR